MKAFKNYHSSLIHLRKDLRSYLCHLKQRGSTSHLPGLVTTAPNLLIAAITAIVIATV
jgi:hypothetical protein